MLGLENVVHSAGTTLGRNWLLPVLQLQGTSRSEPADREVLG